MTKYHLNNKKYADAQHWYTQLKNINAIINRCLLDMAQPMPA